MFRKIVTEVIYSPALAGTLGGYIKRLRNESSKRQIGLIFVALAVLVQLFATLFPPESANANNPGMFLDGGVQSIENYLDHYDQNTKNVRDLLVSLGISRSEIESSTPGTLPVAPGASLWSMEDSRQLNSTAHYFKAGAGKSGIAYRQPISSQDTAPAAYIGTSSSLEGWFAILKDTGNLVTEKSDPSECATSTVPAQPLIVDARRGDTACTDALALSLSARSISPGSSTSLEKVHASDRIVYTVSITNQSDTDMPLIPTISLEDILEYSRILDNGGGEYDFDARTLGWPATTLAANNTLERNFTIQLLPTIPSTARGQHVIASYDCTISALFGNTLSIPVGCPLVKHVEQLTNSLPHLSVKANLIFGASLLFIALYFYLRTRQLIAELHIIRYTYLGGV